MVRTLNKRIEWVDIGKAICIFCILLAHLESNTTILSTFYEPFHLTMFFFLSGYVYKDKGSFSKTLWSKVKILLLPWLIYSLLNIFASAIITLHSDFDLSEAIIWNFLQIRGQNDGLWFIAALFVAYIPFYFVIKLNKPVLSIAISAALSVASVLYSTYFPAKYLPWGTTSLPWHLEYMFQAMLWMVLGYWFRNACIGQNTVESSMENFFESKKSLFLVAPYTGIVYLSESYVGGTVGRIFADYILSLIAIVILIAICKHIKMNAYMRFLGQNTLLYFALHGKVKDLIQVILRTYFTESYNVILNNIIYSTFFALAFAFLLSIILIVPIVVLSLISVLYSNLMNPEIFPWGSTALPWHLEYIFQAMLWMVLGYYFRAYAEESFDRLNTVLNRVQLGLQYVESRPSKSQNP